MLRRPSESPAQAGPPHRDQRANWTSTELTSHAAVRGPLPYHGLRGGPGMNRSILGGIVIAFLLCTCGASCILSGRSERRARPADLDFKLGPFTYIEEGKLVPLA